MAYWRILEPGTVFRGPLDPVMQSDFVDLNSSGFCATPRGDPCFTFGRAGDEPVDLVFTTCPGEKCIVENGDVQTITTLVWSDGTIDTIEFISTEPTPEPSTLLLLCTGMVGVGATGRRRYFSRVFSNTRTRGVSAAPKWKSQLR